VILELLFCTSIVLYWFAEGVSEGFTWAKPKRKRENLLIVHQMNERLGGAGLMDYHGWRLLENLGIWASVIIAFFLDTEIEQFFLLGTGSWLIGSCLYEFALNHVNAGTIWKPWDFKWHILGYDIPWWGGKKVLLLPSLGMAIIAYSLLI
jgi:hypothetical protein